ncbi:MAG: hypothetical protein P4L33_06510 [Capsulimonadaceae bacterium]|nr:hypothetical protein [Capsulimonadaceae bacterium]
MNTSQTLLKIIAALSLAVVLPGCHHDETASPAFDSAGGVVANLRAPVETAHNEFTGQKSFDPWVLTTTDPKGEIPAYLGNGATGVTYGHDGMPNGTIAAGQYKGGALVVSGANAMRPALGDAYKQTLDLRTGILQTVDAGKTVTAQVSGADWASIWKDADISIAGDPEAQQVTHANLFYLLSSIAPKTSNSIPPMGLSGNIYGGHIFWDAEIWMLPALLPQFPDRVRSMIDYRFKRLAQAKANAAAHKYQGAEYPWESADTGKEEAPAEFAAERHITADVAYAAWQYYLWTGDKDYLNNECVPILVANADYWVSRAKKGADGKYHITKVLSPDETADQVDDDAWTNGVVIESLKAAIASGAPVKPAWRDLVNGLQPVFDSHAKRYLEHAGANDKLIAKQADTQMLVYPLDLSMPAEVAANTLDYTLAHTMKVGPAMTSSIDATVSARLGRGQQSLDLFHDSYRPFMRSGLAAFSEKRTANRVYFCTGMGGCLQPVLYGFCGLNVAWGQHKPHGALVAKADDASLYADPHLPPGWTSLTLKGVKFRGSSYTLQVGPANRLTVTKDARP